MDSQAIAIVSCYISNLYNISCKLNETILLDSERNEETFNKDDYFFLFFKYDFKIIYTFFFILFFWKYFFGQ